MLGGGGIGRREGGVIVGHDDGEEGEKKVDGMERKKERKKCVMRRGRVGSVSLIC